MKDVIRLIDPAKPGCGRRLRLASLIALAIVVTAGLFAMIHLARMPLGRYSRGAFLIEVGAPERAIGIARPLVEEYGTENSAYHELLATALSRAGDPAASLIALDDGRHALPRSWRLHNRRCTYGGLHGEARSSLEACEMAIEMARTPEERNLAVAHRGMVRGILGDLDGALDDLRASIAPLDPRSAQTIRPWNQWLEALEGGTNPWDEATLQLERERY